MVCKRTHGIDYDLGVDMKLVSGEHVPAVGPNDPVIVGFLLDKRYDLGVVDSGRAVDGRGEGERDVEPPVVHLAVLVQTNALE